MSRQAYTRQVQVAAAFDYGLQHRTLPSTQSSYEITGAVNCIDRRVRLDERGTKRVAGLHRKRIMGLLGSDRII